MPEDDALWDDTMSPDEPETEHADLTQQNNANKAEEAQQQYLRLAADFENYRKRQTAEREQFYKYAAQSTLESLLPVLDNLERAKQGLSENADPKMLYKSFDMVSQQLLTALKNAGLEKMTPKGEAFDPVRHEAVNQQEDDTQPEHTVIQVYQDGYLLKDKVIRHAQVVVSTKSQHDVSSVDGFDPSEAQQPHENPFQHSGAPQGE